MRPANNQAAQEENNPCLKVGIKKNNILNKKYITEFIFQEHNLSLKCLNDNNYKHDACEAHFENYKQCKAFWVRTLNITQISIIEHNSIALKLHIIYI